jgi:tRNA (Thr-GGU) A37 N-methylase
MTRGRSARVHLIGVIRSTLRTRGAAPKQGGEGAPDAWLEVNRGVAEGVDGIVAGADIVVLTWLHLAGCPDF